MSSSAKTGNGHTPHGNGSVRGVTGSGGVESNSNGNNSNNNGVAGSGRCPFSAMSKASLSEKLRTTSLGEKSTFPSVCPMVRFSTSPITIPNNGLSTNNNNNNSINSNNLSSGSNNRSSKSLSTSSFDESDLFQPPTPSPISEISAPFVANNVQNLNSSGSHKLDLRILSVALMKFLYPKSTSVYNEIGDIVSRRAPQIWESARRNFSVLKQSEIENRRQESCTKKSLQNPRQQIVNSDNSIGTTTNSSSTSTSTSTPTSTTTNSNTANVNGSPESIEFDCDYEHFPLLERFAKYLGKKLELNWEELIVECGEQYGNKCLLTDVKPLKFIGDNLIEFLVNVENIQMIMYRETANLNSGVQQYWPPAQLDLLPVTVFVNHSETRAVITYNVREPICRLVACFLSGMLRRLAKILYNIVISVRVEIGSDQYKIYLENRNENETLVRSENFVGRYKRSLLDKLERANIADQGQQDAHQQLLMSVHTFGRIFPFHWIADQNLRLIQYGSGLRKVFARDKHREHLSTAFNIREPNVGFFFESIRHRTNLVFVLRLRDLATSEAFLGLELKGQIIECVESKCLLFLGSPIIKGLQSLTSRGLFLSDIPIHDATRDIILVEEQSRAQESLKRRMDKLKENIQKASQAVEIERSKNVDLLNLIFPANVARLLWLGQSVKARQYDDVTMLFSDIVGFTSICSSASPMAIINMLNELYTQFDVFCGELDVYKTETIGDAYCVASGIHKRSKYHATKAAFMALKMIWAVKNFRPKDLNVDGFQMRIGLHSGTCLAGIVGVKMPRYCLFGANVTLANKFESHSEPLRINISPVTFKLLCQYPGFVFTKRPPTTLPKDVPADMEKVCYFIDEFRHPDLGAHLSQNEHIAYASEETENWEKNG